MKWLKRAVISVILLDNFLTQLPKKVFFPSAWALEGRCKQCGICCKEIYLKMTPRQIGSKFFTRLAVAWITWAFDFILLKVDHQHNYLVFTCKHCLPDGRCGNYFWRPSVCRNYPLVDYFEKPRTLPGCGFKARPR